MRVIFLHYPRMVRPDSNPHEDEQLSRDPDPHEANSVSAPRALSGSGLDQDPGGQTGPQKNI